MRYPPAWHLQRFENVCRVGFSGAMVSNVPNTYRSPASANGCFWPPSMKTLPRDGVVVEFDHMAGGPAPIPASELAADTSFPLSMSDVPVVGSGKPVRRSTNAQIGASGRYTLNVWIGEDAAPIDVAIARQIVASIGPDFATALTDWSSLLAPSGQWLVSSPADWYRQPFAADCGRSSGYWVGPGVFVSNVPFHFGHRTPASGCTPRWDLQHLPRDAAVVDIEPPLRGGVPNPCPSDPLLQSCPPDTSFPLQLTPEEIGGGAADPIGVPPPTEYEIPIVLNGARVAVVRVWIGDQASARDRSLVTGVLRSIAFAYPATG
jgi:hypothetical protein